MTIDGFETIVGEARYAFEPDTASFEFGLSVDDRWQGQGIGSALLGNLECRAAAFGATRLFGDTLRSNEVDVGACPQIRLRLRAHAQRLEAGAIRKTYRCRATGNSLCKLAACRGRPRHEQCFGELSRQEVSASIPLERCLALFDKHLHGLAVVRRHRGADQAFGLVVARGGEIE